MELLPGRGDGPADGVDAVVVCRVDAPDERLVDEGFVILWPGRWTGFVDHAVLDVAGDVECMARPVVVELDVDGVVIPGQAEALDEKHSVGGHVELI